MSTGLAMTSITEIPVVDFAGFSTSDPAQRAATAGALRAAFESCGFLYLYNHGVPAEVLDAVLAQSRTFFALPPAVKEAARAPKGGGILGYEGVGVQALEKGRPGDLKEIFQATAERPDARPNVWPAGMPRFHEAVMAFHDAAVAACDQIMHAMAVSLGLPEAYFEPFYDHSDTTARLLHYPPLLDAPLPGQIRAGAHTDFGGVSLLFPGEEGDWRSRRPTAPGCRRQRGPAPPW